ncbi:deoxyribodipyrimidine photo-lyase [Nocardioides szechwanensis]|uniref:Deoxyribodipyrimidine photo-lyase n=1 Tax=Nocardioides szechwanensis TaxID=1005944 RepID=A0A1G9Z9C7_9ACTN|nr:deoxyribodipyrimidine photo-lyase [Nocardioides szechwanensis]GEP33842.1 deoxyribodipyrimidine photo-lyase [Nocardioides szechwanensis]SDN17226.1 deoxyribodipyrimidine photo-lyase [Nocardioides szechwanensis]
MPAVMWFRRDLRLRDNPALLEACADGAVLPLFVLDPALWEPAGPARRAYLAASLRSLAGDLPLAVVTGDPVRRVVQAAVEVGAERVHVAADFGPYGHARDLAVEQALAEAGVELVRTGSPYAVAPGRVTSGAGTPFKVFTPYSKAWADHGWRDPVDPPPDPTWLGLAETADLPDAEAEGVELPEAGEAAARRQWAGFLDRVGDYGDDRDRPGVDGTSRMSPHLKWGEVHPRTLLADLARLRSDGAATYRKELAWREFYADVLFAHPHSARDYLKPDYARMRYDDPADHLEAWCQGRTGFPVVDAGMRQLRAIGWMHNRVRMIVASFLVKDLHVEWQHGARHFMHSLVDGDLASNQHGWQWVAGSGTDASPYFRVFNPTTQGRKFDPDATYVRQWVPELADLPEGADPHDPSPADRDEVGYPQPIVDHAAERREALARYEEIR